MKNILVISGGSGNDALLKGIFHYYEKAKVKVLVNAYDDGKSTGICRTITNTLGVSDIRKNHYRMYCIKHQSDKNRGIDSFYKERFDLPSGSEPEFVIEKLYSWGLERFICYVKPFFDFAKRFAFKDFSIANIIYAQMYKEIGYEKTNAIMCEMLGIEDFVIMNSYENVVIGAKTDKKIIENEASIVDFSTKEDKIESIIYKSDFPVVLNPKAIDSIMDADIIIISTGTFWSSIYPTLEYGHLYKVINRAKGKKIWMMNNEEDKDSFGVGSNDFIEKVSNLGLNLNDFTIIENSDASEILRQPNSTYNVVYYPMGNINGRHDGLKMAQAIFLDYYGIGNKMFDDILIDFDKTLYDKNAQFEVVESNLVEVAKNRKIIIVSGNDYKTHIKPILQRVFGDKMFSFQNKIWADASSILYVVGEKVSLINENVIKKEIVNRIDNYLSMKFGIRGSVNDESVTCYKIKPLNNLERNVLCELLNRYVLKEMGIKGIKAIKAGNTTIDIVSECNDKKLVIEKSKLGKTLYIGDELMDFGNDYAIARKCDHSIAVENIYETNLILKILAI